MRLVAARLAVPVARRPVVVATIFATDALVASLGLNQRAIDAEMFARQQAPFLRHFHRRVEQLRHRVEFQ